MFHVTEYQSKSFDPTNKKVIGKMKDVYKGKPTCEFVRLKWKMHGVLSDDGKESNIANGITIAIEFNEYKDTLFDKKSSQKQNEKNSQQKTKLEHMRSKKYHYHVWMIKDTS